MVVNAHKGEFVGILYRQRAELYRFVRKYPRQCPVNAHRYTMQPTQVYYNTQSHATHSLKVYIATQYTKKMLSGEKTKEQPKAGLQLNDNH